MKRIHLKTILLALLVLTTVGCDLSTKQLAVSHLAGADPVPLISGVLDLTYTQNEGAAFNLERILPRGARKPLIILSRAIFIPLALILWLRRRSAPIEEHLGYAMLLAGGIGNFVEMLGRGHVTDFIHLHHWPIFNVADIAIVLGVAALLLSSWFRRPARSPA
jgi:signal peptidase II